MRHNLDPPTRSRVSAVVLAGLISVVVIHTHPVTAATVYAQPAHSFINSVGVNTRFGWFDSPYRTRYSEIKARLAELGIRHIRDKVSGPSTASIFRNLYLTMGVRLLPVVNLRIGSGATLRLDASQIEQHIGFIRKAVGTAALVGVEGPNEANIQERDHGYRGWPTDLYRFQEKLYKTIRADPAFAGRKVLQPSIGGPYSNLYYERMGDYSRIADIANIHPYSNWAPWERGATRSYDFAEHTMRGRPFWATETGWHTSINGQSLNKFTMLRYFPRALVGFGSFRNLKRGYIYQLVDPREDPARISDNFGLLDYDLNEKPGFYAIRNMMHVLCDDPLRSAPGALRYSLSGNLADLRTLLYQKNNGAFYLVSWLEKPGKVGISPTESRDIINPPQVVRIKFEQGVSLVRRYNRVILTGT